MTTTNWLAAKAPPPGPVTYAGVALVAGAAAIGAGIGRRDLEDHRVLAFSVPPELAPFLDQGPFDERSLTYPWTHPDARMDRLYESVAAVAEEAARADEDPAVTFARIHEMAAAMERYGMIPPTTVYVEK